LRSIVLRIATKTSSVIAKVRGDRRRCDQNTIKGNVIVLKISKAALLAAVLSLSATPAILAQENLGNDTANSHSSTTDTQYAFDSHVSIPTVVAVGSSMDESALRDALTGGFAKHIDELAKLSATSITIPEITLTMSSKAGATSATSTVSYKDLVLSNVKDGVAESASVGSAVSLTQDGTFTFGKMSTGLLDIGGILALYQMVPSSADRPMKPIYKDFTWDGAKFETPEVSCDIGKIHTDEFDARPLKVSFGELMDASKQMEQVQTGATPPPEAVGKVITFLTDVFQAFKSTPTSVGAVTCTGKNKDGKDFTLGLGGVQMEGFSPGRYPAITISDLTIAAADGHIGLKSGTFKTIDFTQPIATLKDAGTDIAPQWFETNWRKIIPAWAGLSLSGLSVDVPDEKNPGERVQVEMADFDLSLSDYLNGIPTKITSSAHGVAVPLPPDSDDDNAKMLKAIGITKINANYELSASWDKASQTVKVDKASVSGNDLGSMVLTALIGNATEQLFDPDPKVQQVAGLGVTIKNLNLTATDAGLGDKLVPMLAAQQNADPATYRTQMAGVAEGAALQMLGSTDAARALGVAVGDFLSGKSKSVSINVAAKDPNGITVPMLMQASNDPTVLANAVDITGSAGQ